jgi:hypothetical protein
MNPIHTFPFWWLTTPRHKQAARYEAIRRNGLNRSEWKVKQSADEVKHQNRNHSQGYVNSNWASCSGYRTRRFLTATTKAPTLDTILHHSNLLPADLFHKLSLCFNRAQRQKGVLGSGGVGHAFLTSAGGEWSASRYGRPSYPVNRRLCGPQSLPGHGGEGKNSQPLPGFEPTVAQRYTTELFRFLLPQDTRMLSSHLLFGLPNLITPVSKHHTVKAYWMRGT